MSPSASSANEAPLVVLDAVDKRYGKKHALRQVSLVLKHRARLLIVGGNGSGKSTLLRVLAGIAPVSTGTAKPSAAFQSMRVCYVPQIGGLYPGLTVTENARALAYLLGAGMPDDLSEHRHIRALGVDAYLDVKVRELSGGFQKLASLACALAVEPRGLFLDEPLTGIDRERCAKVMESLDSLGEELDFLVVTDHSTTRLSSPSQVVLLSAGVIQ